MTKVKGSFELASWDEETYEELDGGAKLTRASVTQAFHGDLEGDGSVEWLMAYRPDGTAHFVGLQRVEGSLEGRKGTFVLDTAGDFDGKAATWHATVVEGSATADLTGLRGTATFGAPKGPKAEFELDYELEPS
jgi:hypothetical protein